jgi:hypothetical protein
MKPELNLLLEANSRGKYSRQLFGGLELVSPALVVIAGAGTPESLQHAQKLHKGLVSEIEALGPDSPPVDETPVEDPFAYSQGIPSETQKLLVMVGERPDNTESHGAHIEPLHRNTTELHERWLTAGAAYHILPAYPVGAPVSKLLPDNEALRKINVRFWRKDPAEAIPDVLAAAGVTTREFRIFISYRRWQTASLALQLWDELNKHNFDVFFDQFRIDSGVNFQQKLIEDLADKSMVLLLESSDFEGSEWTREEISFTKIHRLGLLALKVPDGGSDLPEIDPNERIDLVSSAFEHMDAETLKWENGYRAPENQQHPEQNRLTPDALKTVVERICLEHGRAFLRRRRQFRAEMTAALRQANVAVTDFEYGPEGLLWIWRPDRQHPSKRYVVWLAIRPPDLADFHLTHCGCPDQPKCGIVIGLSKYMATERKSRMDWLSQVCQVRFFDEGQLTHIAKDIANRAL